MTSRRKQTNPNRVSAGARDPEALALTSMTESDPSQGSGYVPEDGPVLSSSPGGQPMEDDAPESRGLPSELHNGHEDFETLRMRMEERMEERDLDGPDMKKARIEAGGNPEDFPTAYHRLGRELFESTAPDMPLTNGHMENGPSPLPGRSDSTPSPRDMVLPPLSKPPLMSDRRDSEDSSLHPPPTPPSSKCGSKDGGSSEGGNGSKERIFHMDAYCDLCDREFCNKYFLKTHKANKHGIYEDNSPPASSVPLPFPGLMMHQDPLASFNFKMDSIKPLPPSSEPLIPWSFKLDPSSPVPKKRPDSSPTLKGGMEPPLPMFPIPMPGLEPSKLSPSTPKSGSSNNNNNSSSSPSSSNNNNNNISSSSSSASSSATSILTTITNSIKSGSNSNPPANDPSMEDYCHICQKHFCNKYYLKKHKNDVHGIAPETPTNSTSKRSRSSTLHDLPITSNSHMMLPQPLASLAGMPNMPGMHGLPNMPGMANMPTMPNMPPGVMVINPYSLPPVAIIPTGSLMPGQQMPHPHHPMISQPMSITPLPDSALLPPAPPTPSSLSNSSSALPGGPSPNKPSPSQQDSGVVCNICSKEFCSEFYLQIHRESKHGIKRGSEESRDKALSLVKERDGSKSDGSRLSPPPLSSMPKSEPSVVSSSSSPNRLTPSSVEGHLMVCSLCNKEFTNKYLYRIHRIHDHGLNELVDPTLVEHGEMPSKEDAMRSMNESLMRMAADASAVGYASSFRPGSPGKPTESAVCDICNKEMTNQYFLRIHKFNIHGIDPSSNEKNERRPLASPNSSKPKTPPNSGSHNLPSPSQPHLGLPHHTPGKPPMLPFLPPKMDFKDMPPFADFSRDFKHFRDMPSFLSDTISNELFARSHNPARHMDLNFFGLPSLGKLPGEDNVKLNFDPEAYCEICKKEFCSKYFLRTHKQNIHGIKTDVTTSGSSSRLPEPEKSIMSMSPLKPNLSMSMSNGKPKDGYEKSSWRWKEPVNSSRVVCDICNKEVCNKYFLRTHKLKKHGIPPSSQSPNVSMSGSPVASDCDTASNTSSLADEKPGRFDPFSLPQMIPLPPSDKFPKMSFGKGKDEIPLNNNTEQSETCNLCNRRFKNMKWLKEHILKDHSESEALDMRSKNSPPVYTCQVCGIDFPAELSVQLHLIQEHNARVTLNTEESQIPTEEPGLPNGEGKTLRFGDRAAPWSLHKRYSQRRRVKKYVCTRCDFDTHYLSCLLEHERENHGISSDPEPVYFCSQCEQGISSPSSLSAHMVTMHGFTVEQAVAEVKNSDAKSLTSFKCTHCPAIFPSQTWAMAHVRHVHVRGKRDLCVKDSFEKSPLRCPTCPFKTHFSSRMQRHVKSKHRRSLQRAARAAAANCSNVGFTSASLGTGGSNTNNNSPGTSSSSAYDEEQSIPNSNAMYKSIAASLLSAPENTRSESPPNKACDREELLLQSYKLPISSSMDSSPFSMAAPAPAPPAVVGL